MNEALRGAVPADLSAASESVAQPELVLQMTGITNGELGWAVAFV